jgi:sensor histidine kinase regulating citrate/malate metabolism
MPQTTATGQSPRQVKFPYLLLLFSFGLVLASYFYISNSLSQYLSQAITQTTQAGNASLTRAFVNVLYPRLAEDLGLSSNPLGLKQALDAEELARVDQAVREFAFGTDVLKVKLFNIEGVTLYSSDPAQLGEKKTDYPGFRSASQGRSASEISYRDEFSAFEGQLFRRALVSSYIPIQDVNGGVIGVAEIYTDRTNLMDLAGELDLRLKAQLIPLLAVILFLLAAILWRFSYQLTQLRVELLEQDADLPPRS